MSTPGTQRYNRIMLTLMNCGTKITRRLVEKRVKDLSKNGEEDTIDEYLLKNKTVILQQKLGKIKENVFFPPSGHTNLDIWDVCMFCFILEKTCDLSNVTKMRIKKLLKIRHKLCHLNNPTLETIKFDEYTDDLKVSFECFLKEINDEKFTEEMNALVQSLATDPLSIDDTLLKAIHNLYRSEWTQREVLEKIGNGQDLTIGKLDALMEKIERLESRWPSGDSVDIPGIGMVIEVENCRAEEEKEILDTLEKYFNESIKQKVPEEDLPNDVLHTVRESVKQVFRDFLMRGRRITIVKQKCLLLTIKCTSVKSFLEMIRDYRTGDLSLQLSGIETAIKNLPGCSNVQLAYLIFKEEFMEVMDDIVSKLCKRVQQTENTAVQTSSNAENSIRVTLKFPTISERENVQNRFEEMNSIESELRRMLNVERMSLTDKLVPKDDAVSNFGGRVNSLPNELPITGDAVNNPSSLDNKFNPESQSNPEIKSTDTGNVGGNQIANGSTEGQTNGTGYGPQATGTHTDGKPTESDGISGQKIVTGQELDPGTDNFEQNKVPEPDTTTNITNISGTGTGTDTGGQPLGSTGGHTQGGTGGHTLGDTGEEPQCTSNNNAEQNLGPSNTSGTGTGTDAGGQTHVGTGGHTQGGTGGHTLGGTGGQPQGGTGEQPQVGTGGHTQGGTGGQPLGGTGGQPLGGTGGHTQGDTEGQLHVGTGGQPQDGTGGYIHVGTGGQPLGDTGGQPPGCTGGQPLGGTGGHTPGDTGGQQQGTSNNNAEQNLGPSNTSGAGTGTDLTAGQSVTKTTYVKDGRRKENKLASTCPGRIPVYAIQSHDTSGYDTQEEKKRDKVSIVRVPVKMTKEVKDWFLKADQLQTDVKKRLPDRSLMKKINAAINRTKHMDNEEQFLADMEKLLDGTTFKKCRPDLKALWAYQTEILKKEFEVAF